MMFNVLCGIGVNCLWLPECMGILVGGEGVSV